MKRMKYVALIVAGILISPTLSEAQSKEKITFDRHVLPIFESKCNDCHNADVAAGDLDLTTYSGAMAGGGSGAVISPGDPDGSKLFRQVIHTERPYMPPEEPKINKKSIALLKAWIAGGALRDKNSKAAKKKKMGSGTILAAPSIKGPPPMPPQLNKNPAFKARRANSITALAQSPTAKLVAVGAYKQVLLFNSDNYRLRGILKFPEGHPQILTFSPTGEFLLAGGGRGSHSGQVVLWNMRTGQRVMKLGKEYDIVLAASISRDHALVALSGPSKIVKVFSTATGQLLYKKTKHTDWVTSVAFSPDGVLLASGDRNGGLYIWESETGREFSELKGHSAAITDLSWRADSNVLASASEDRTTRLWRAEDGAAIRRWNAHGGGTLSVDYSRDGRLLTCGRDYRIRVWNQNGKALKEVRGTRDMPTRVVFNKDGKRFFSGDYGGQLTSWDAKSGKVLRREQINLPTIKERMVAIKQRLPKLKGEAQKATQVLAGAEKKLSKVKKRHGVLTAQRSDQMKRRAAWTQREKQLGWEIPGRKKRFEDLQEAVNPLHRRFEWLKTVKKPSLTLTLQDRWNVAVYRGLIAERNRLTWRVPSLTQQFHHAEYLYLTRKHDRRRYQRKLRKLAASLKKTEQALVQSKKGLEQVTKQSNELRQRSKRAAKTYLQTQRSTKVWLVELELSEKLSLLERAQLATAKVKAAEKQARSEDALAQMRVKKTERDILKSQNASKEAVAAVAASKAYLTETAKLSAQAQVIHDQAKKTLQSTRSFADQNSKAAARALEAATKLKGEKALVDAAAKAWDLAEKAKEDAQRAVLMEKKAALSAANLKKSRAAAEHSVLEGQKRVLQANAEEKRLKVELEKAKSRAIETASKFKEAKFEAEKFMRAEAAAQSVVDGVRKALKAAKGNS